MTTTTELHTAIAQMQALMKQAADVIEHNASSLGEAHTRNGIIEDREVQAAVESDTDLVAHLRAAALPWDRRQKLAEQPAPAQQCTEHGECFGGKCIYPDTQQAQQQEPKFSARDDAERLKSVGRGMSYNDASEAVWKHTLMEIAMRLETGGYTPTPAQPAQQQEPDYKALWQQMCERCDELDAKLAQPQQEPVAWRVKWPAIGGGYKWLMVDRPLMEKEGFVNEALFTSPPAQRKPLTDVIKAAQGVLEWTEIAPRPPVRDKLEAGRMVMVRLHALADLHDALTAHGIKEQQPIASTLTKSDSRSQCWKCGDSDPAYTDVCQVPACGMREGN